jgi:hypothetical protein
LTLMRRIVEDKDSRSQALNVKPYC